MLVMFIAKFLSNDNFFKPNPSKEMTVCCLNIQIF